MAMRMRARMQAQGGTNPAGNQAASFTTDRPPYPGAFGMENPRMVFFWLGFLAVLFFFHVGGARLP